MAPYTNRLGLFLLVASAIGISCADQDRQLSDTLLGDQHVLRIIESLQSQNRELLTKFANLEARTNELSETVSNLKSEKKQILQRMDELDADNRRQAEEIRSLKCKEPSIEHDMRDSKHVDNMSETASDMTRNGEDSGYSGRQIRDDLNDSVTEKRDAKNVQNRETKNEAASTEDSHARALAIQESPVAFFATITPHDVTGLGINQAIRFDNVVTNLGNAYHATHGNFIAPDRGLYVFSGTVAADDNCWVYVHYTLNGRLLAKAHIRDSHSMAGQTVVLVLNQGDDVFLAYAGNAGCTILGDHYSSFAGLLITRL